MKRIVKPETLDTLPPDDPVALRSRRDLRRINAWMQNHKTMARVLAENLAVAPRQITDLGAGDGNFLLQVAQASRLRGLNATLLDLQKNVPAETLAEFSKCGWRAEAVVADVFDWPQMETEVVVANLFLHHFEDDELRELFRTIAARAKLFIAVEPHRFHFPFPCAQSLRLIGCGKITRHDAEASIAAGFVRKEISALWPDKTGWRLAERRAGLFSHLFVARKAE
jgi:hypothetical protein